LGEGLIARKIKLFIAPVVAQMSPLNHLPQSWQYVSYCQTTVLKDAESVKDIGKMASVLEDYSPLQIGTTGIYQQQGFTLLGRIQLKYEDGLWNEWYALFDDGKEGWLSEASGQYTFNFLDGQADRCTSF
jgi:hypothetical protein